MKQVVQDITSKEAYKVAVNYYAESNAGEVVQDTCEMNVKGTTLVGEIAEFIRESIGAKTVVVTGVVR